MGVIPETAAPAHGLAVTATTIPRWHGMVGPTTTWEASKSDEYRSLLGRGRASEKLAARRGGE